jgi:hypothetical protein
MHSECAVIVIFAEAISVRELKRSAREQKTSYVQPVQLPGNLLKNPILNIQLMKKYVTAAQNA